MKLFISKFTTSVNKRLLHVALAVLFVISMGITYSGAQMKAKRVTSIQLGKGSEGARVTIVADSALNDYEAFRRGDRFYVRIPGAEFVASAPTFRGDGFDDIQVQKVGDSVVISFKLQPGSNARVDDGANRLEVLFTSASLLARNSDTTAVRSRVTSPASRVSSRNRDAAGPMPPGSPDPSTERLVESATTTNDVGEPRWTDNRNSPLYRSSRTGTSAPSESIASKATPTPFNSATPVSTPWSSYPVTTISTPVPPAQAPATPAQGTASSLKARAQSMRQWASAHRFVTLAGAAVLLALLAFGLVLVVRRKRGVHARRRPNVPRVQPKLSEDLGFDEMGLGHSPEDESEVEFVEDLDFEELQSETSFTSGQFAASGPGGFPNDSLWNDSRAAASSLKSSAYLTRDEQEREVFEL